LYQNQNIFAETDTSFTIHFPENTKGTVIFNNSIFENILTYIADLNNYEYGCVEQTASKLKALYYQQEIYNKLKLDKNNQVQLKAMYKKLGEMQNTDGSFGWWKNSYADNYMTTYAYDAMSIADKEGRTHRKSKEYLIKQLSKKLTVNQLYTAYTLAKHQDFPLEQIDLSNINTTDLQTTDKVYYYKLKSMKGEEITEMEWYQLTLELDKYKNYRYDGNFFYEPRAVLFNAFSILKGTSIEKEFSDKFRFQITNGLLANNLNTYSKAALIQAMIEDAKTDANPVMAEVWVNQEPKFTAFPKIIPINHAKTMQIRHKGAPVWVNTAEEIWVENPATRDSVFSIKSSFSSTLKRGETSTLSVEIYTYKTKDYVMIEIPIPAGVVIKNKPQSINGSDYIEYKDEKILIFQSKMYLGQSKYSFEIEPVYAGKFNIPPAKISMMYYPFVYGNNQKQVVEIR
jgi:hypothetical protein